MGATVPLVSHGPELVSELSRATNRPDGLGPAVSVARTSSKEPAEWTSRLPLCVGLCHHPSVNPLKLIETSPGKYSLLLNAGTTDVDDLIEELGHEPHGYFWEGVARLLVSTEAPALEGRFSYDPEAGMFCAYGEERGALEELATRMAAVAGDPERVRQLVALAEATGFEFDD